MGDQLDHGVHPRGFTRFYSKREIGGIVWLVASVQPSNVTNIALHIGSDGLCELTAQRATRASKSSPNGARKKVPLRVPSVAAYRCHLPPVDARQPTDCEHPRSASPIRMILDEALHSVCPRSV